MSTAVDIIEAFFTNYRFITRGIALTLLLVYLTLRYKTLQGAQLIFRHGASVQKLVGFALTRAIWKLVSRWLL